MRGIERRKLLLRLAGRLGDALHGRLVAPQVNPMLALEGVQQVRSHALVEVVAAQMVVARRGQHLNDVVADLDDRHVERAAAQVVHHHLLRRAVVQAVGESCSRGLVDDAEHFEARDLAGVLRGLALRVVEVRGHRDDGLRHRGAQLLLGVVLQLLQYHGGDFLRRVVLAVDVDHRAAVLALLQLVADGLALFRRLVVGTADEALHGRHGVLGVRDGLVLRGLAHDALAVLAEALDRRSGAVALGVHEDFGLGALHDGHGGVRRAQVDTKNLAHYPASSLLELLPK